MGILEASLDDAEILPTSHRDALINAVDILVDQFLEDVNSLSEVIPGVPPPDIKDTSISAFLPERYVHRYDGMFAKKFLICLIVVSWKLRSNDAHTLACTAEELALYALLREARGLLEDSGTEVDFGAFEDLAFEDMDFELLFDPAWDGIEDYGNELTGGQARLVNLRFDDWFRPFREEVPVHPYVDPRRD